MKKTSQIHLAGILFNIEEDAYETLSEYIKSIESHFAQHSGKKEILEDIENRMAEILSAKLSANKQVITIDDVQELIAIMGKPNEFDDSDTSGEQNTETYTINRKFYRHPDDKIIGGVCGGIAAYFNIDPLWIRLAWAVAFFVFGSGLLFYILLWIIIPEAKTVTQKLEMRGEKINISSISKGIEEDLKAFGKRVSDTGTKFSSNKVLAFFQSIFQHIIRFLSSLIVWLGKAFAVFFLVLFIFIIIVLLASVFAENVWIIQSRNFNLSILSPSEFFTSSFHYGLFNLSLFLLIGVPLLAIVAWLIKFLFRIKKSIRYISITAIILWLIGWGLFIYSFIPLVEQYAEKNYYKTEYVQYTMPHKTYYIKMNETDADTEEAEEDEEDFNITISNSLDDKYRGFSSLSIKRSKDDSLRIKIINSALGKSSKEARQFAQNIQYQFSINDSIIALSARYDIPKEDKFHFQKVKVILEIPQNRYVYLSENLSRYLTEAENNINADEEEMLGKKWLMGIDHLQCIENCDDIKDASAHKKQQKKRKLKKEDEEYD